MLSVPTESEATNTTYRLGIDIGGTFTDTVLVNERTGQVHVLKVPSNRREPWKAVLAALQRVAKDHGVDPAAIRYFVHGTTLATNTIIERSGARTALLVTEGFRDILEIGRMRMNDVLDFQGQALLPLIPRGDVVEISERILASGQVRTPLKSEDVRQAVERLVADGAQALAVCFLHSYAFDQHEQLAGETARAVNPDLYLALSSDVWPELREYERAIVAVIDAYVGPRMTGYFTAIEEALRAEGLTAPILVTRSNGGIMTALTARTSAAQTLLSGPASGVMGAADVAQRAGFPRIIGFDMGGTSADIAIVDGDPLLSTEGQVGDFPVVMPSVDVSSIGAGGGSIAWMDAGGVLKVGPRSAGSDPGPACLGRGGTEPAITDAYVHLGIIHPDRFLAGELPLNPALSQAALSRLGDGLGISSRDTADAILSVATANMYAQFVPLAARKGIDLNDFVLLAYGGAGPTHACLLAEETGIRRVLVPPSPGTLCARGALTMDVKSDYVRSFRRALDQIPGAELEGAYSRLEASARAWLDGEAIPVEDIRLERSAEMRYVGQGFSINVACPADVSTEEGRNELAQRFHDRHQTVFRHGDPNAQVELTTLRLTIVGGTPKPPTVSSERGVDGAPPHEVRTVYYGGKEIDCAVYSRADIRAGHRFSGPCIIEQYDTTTFVTPRFTVTCDEYGNLLLEATA
jgi:N-methylhydantoinase A